VLEYCLETSPKRGQALSNDLGYVELPADTLKAAREAVQGIQ
jgi:hypothetical protein